MVLCVLLHTVAILCRMFGMFDSKVYEYSGTSICVKKAGIQDNSKHCLKHVMNDNDVFSLETKLSINVYKSSVLIHV